MAKGQWFREFPGGTVLEQHMDFRVGGSEVFEGRAPEHGPGAGIRHRFAAVYHDIVPEQRIVYSYEMTVNGVKLSVSLSTFDIEPSEHGTRLTMTEQGAYFAADEIPGSGPESREEGSRELMDALAASCEA